MKICKIFRQIKKAMIKGRRIKSQPKQNGDKNKDEKDSKMHRREQKFVKHNDTNKKNEYK